MLVVFNQPVMVVGALNPETLNPLEYCTLKTLVAAGWWFVAAGGHLLPGLRGVSDSWAAHSV